MRNFLNLIFGTLIDVVSDRLRERRERKKQEKREAEELSYKTAKENAQYKAEQAAKIRGKYERK